MLVIEEINNLVFCRAKLYDPADKENPASRHYYGHKGLPVQSCLSTITTEVSSRPVTTL